MKLFEALILPNGSRIRNRLAKAAMEENMADSQHAPSDQLIRLYQSWAKGGAGLIITGNVMIDSRAMTGPAGVVLESEQYAERFRQWSAAARSEGAQVWMQINHPGRQMPAALGQPTIAPSAVALDLGNLSGQFAMPRAMTEDDIAEVRRRFVQTAVLAQKFGYDGVQIHAAHGYLLSQFLSPLSNQRTDRWGGSIDNRARLLIEVIREVRQAVGPAFGLAVKLNSADFQRGGFSPEDASQVVGMLNHLPVDLIELSGGSYEAPAMHGQTRDGRTLAREAYFLEFAREIAGIASIPLMVTGGIRRYPVAQQVLDSGIAMVGMATALAIDPALPNKWQSDHAASAAMQPLNWKNKPLASLAYMAMVKHQLGLLSRGKTSNPEVLPLWALVKQLWQSRTQNRCYRDRMRARSQVDSQAGMVSVR